MICSLSINMNALETMNYVTWKDKVHLVTGNEDTEGEGV